MGYIIKPPLGSVIDWSNPRIKSLTAWYLLNESGGDKLYDTTMQLNLTPSAFTATWANNGLYFNNTKIISSTSMSGNNVTIVIFATPIDITSDQYVLEHGLAASVNIRTIILGYQDNYWNLYHASAYPGSGGESVTRIPASLNQNQMVSYGSNGSVIHGWLNGNRVVTAVGNLNIASSITRFWIGISDLTAAQYYGYLHEIMYFNTLLTDSDIQYLYTDRYKLIKTVPIWQYYQAPSGVNIPSFMNYYRQLRA